jgi:hypothetical protein
MGIGQKKQKPEYTACTCKRCGKVTERRTIALTSLSKHFCGPLCVREYQHSRKVSKARTARFKPSARQRGAISPKVRKQLRERSNGQCERCGGVAAHAAHIKRRWKHEVPPTVEDLLHLCITCHAWADQTRDGRDWLKSFEKPQIV